MFIVWIWNEIKEQSMRLGWNRQYEYLNDILYNESRLLPTHSPLIILVSFVLHELINTILEPFLLLNPKLNMNNLRLFGILNMIHHLFQMLSVILFIETRH